MIKGSKCGCGFAAVPKRKFCVKCGKETEDAEFGDTGTMLTYTVLEVPPEGFEPPLKIAMIKLDDRPKLVCWSRCGMEVDKRVKVIFEEDRYYCIEP